MHSEDRRPALTEDRRPLDGGPALDGGPGGRLTGRLPSPETNEHSGVTLPTSETMVSVAMVSYSHG